MEEFLDKLRRLREEQRALLSQTESEGRASGALDLEELERELERLKEK